MSVKTMILDFCGSLFDLDYWVSSVHTENHGFGQIVTDYDVEIVTVSGIPASYFSSEGIAELTRAIKEDGEIMSDLRTQYEDLDQSA